MLCNDSDSEAQGKIIVSNMTARFIELTQACATIKSLGFRVELVPSQLV